MPIDQRKIACLRKAAAIAASVFAPTIAFIRPGITERAVARYLYQQIIARGGDGISFLTIVASGTRSAQIHGRASNKKIRVGDTILFDYGVRYKGYRSDISRTVYLGSLTSRQRKIYSIVLKAQHAAVRHLKAGALCADIDSYARKFITKAGFGKKFPHSTGHGLSCKVHAAPKIGPRSKAKLQEGDIVTIEPGIYIKGWGGVRIEDDYLITKHGAKCLTSKALKDRPVVIKVH